MKQGYGFKMDPLQGLMMMQMLGGGEGDAPGGMDIGALLGLMQGEEPAVESVWEDAVPFGTARDRNGDETVGILEIRITPPHADDPTPRVRVKTNGVILARPEHLRKIASAFNRFAEDKLALEVWEQVNSPEAIAAAEAAAAEKRSSNAMMGMLK
jgi:hypothetical protein